MLSVKDSVCRSHYSNLSIQKPFLSNQLSFHVVIKQKSTQTNVPKLSWPDYHEPYFHYYASLRFFAWTCVSPRSVSACCCFCWGAQIEKEMGLISSSGFFYTVSHLFFCRCTFCSRLVEAALMHHICLGWSSGEIIMTWESKDPQLLCMCVFHLFLEHYWGLGPLLSFELWPSSHK